MHATDILGYTFEADTYCVSCTEKHFPGSTDWQREGFNPSDYVDSEGNEIHPIFVSDSEADTPEHCADCHTFLENDLTSEGYDYVADSLTEPMSANYEVLLEWFEFYAEGFAPEHWELMARDNVPAYLRTKLAIVSHGKTHHNF